MATPGNMKQIHFHSHGNCSDWVRARGFHRIRSKTSAEAWFTVFSLILMLVLSAARADQFDDLRLKWSASVTGSGYNPSDPTTASLLTSMASTANSYWSTMNTSGTTGLWSDLSGTTSSWVITSSYTRLRAMALAYASPGCSLQGNTSLATAIISGLDWMNANRYSSTRSEYDNWWDWQIGTPQPLEDTVVLLYNQLTATQITNYMAAVDHFTPSPTQSGATGANLTWQAQVVGVRGCIVKDTNKLAAARDAFTQIFPCVTDNDGFYTDGSFIQHSYHPYTSAYGMNVLASTATMVGWLSGSAWAVTDPARSNICNWVYSAFEPTIYNGLVFDNLTGRVISRSSSPPQASGQAILNAILQITQFAPPADALRMKSMLKQWALNNTVSSFVASTPLANLALAQQIMADPTVPARGELIGHYNFAGMDRVVHLGKGYGFSVAMNSSRIANYECINSENWHGWFTSDGRTTLYNTDLNQYSDNYWPTIDSYRLPGTTADTTAPKTNGQSQSTLSPYSWVGGASLGHYGAAGMQLAGKNVTLVANKSWFMFDDEIICLGSGITSTDSRPIETIVENRQLTSAGNNSFIVNGTPQPSSLGWTGTMANVNWAYLGGNLPGSDIGYYFPQPATLTATREARTGAWSDITSGGATTRYTRNYLRFGFNHGSNPANATYQYALLPGRSPFLLADYAANPPFTVLENDTDAQGVRQDFLGITAVNFWKDATKTVGTVTSNKKASVLVQNNGTFLDVAVSDPTQLNTGTISLTISGSATALINADTGLTVTQLSPNIQLSVAVNQALGQTFHARFYLLAQQPQTVNLPSVADTYSWDAYPTTNYGTESSMAVKGLASYNRDSYVRFDLSSLPTGTITSASVILTPVVVTPPGIHVISRVTDSWGETTLTWSNQPGAGNTITSWTPALNSPVRANVTSAVSSALTSGDNTISFCVSPSNTNTGFFSYGTRESGTNASRPQLQVTYSHCPPTISMTSPTSGTLLGQPGPITLTASAIAGDSPIVRVDFFDSGTLLGSSTGPNFSFPIEILGGGTHHFSAVATDSNGLTGSTTPVVVGVPYPPVANPTAVTTTPNTPITIDLSTLASSVQTPSSSLLFSLGASSNGSAILLGDSHTVSFTPATGFSGAASFIYTVTDASGLTAGNTVSVTVLSSLQTWRQQYFGTTANNGNAADTADPDGDGLSNLQEYIFGTSPTSTNRGALVSTTFTNGTVTLTFTATQASGTAYTGLTRYYQLESSTDLLNWTPITGFTSIVGANQMVTATLPVSTPKSFYRLKAWLQ